jgi:hypothetical protein
MLQSDYFNLSLYHLRPLKWYPWILFWNYLHRLVLTISWLLWINSPNTTTISVTEVETAELFFHHIISKFSIPQQVITDRDARTREFWKEICKRMGMVRSLTMAYHLQANGQTEVLNQSLKISWCAYVGLSRNDWVSYLDALGLSYNTTSHTATKFAPTYLLRGYIPTTRSTLVHHPEGIVRPATGTDSHNLREIRNNDETSLHLALWKCWKHFMPLATKPRKLSCWDNISKGHLAIRDGSLLSFRKEI